MPLPIWAWEPELEQCIHHQQWGNVEYRRQILFLHGWGMNSGVWTPVAKYLQEQLTGYHIIAVDLPGYGQSRSCDQQALGGHYNSVSLAQCLAFLLKDKETIIIGWSMGGLVALEMVCQFPQRVSGLVLVSSSPRFVQGDNWPDAVKASVFEKFYQYLEQDHRATLKRFLAIQAMGSDTARKDIKTLQQQLEQRGELDPSALKDGLNMLLNEDKRALLSEITDIPIDLICGERDTLVNIKAQQQLAQQPNIKLHPVVGAGHTPFISHQDQFMTLLRGILEH